MIFKVPWISIIILVLGCYCSWTISASNGNTGVSTIMKTLEKLILSRGKTCPKRLIKLCKKEPNLQKVLQEAVTLAIEHCHEQFRYTRWNCTLNERLFHEVSRETSVVTGIFAASISHTFARSCVLKKFSKCNQVTEHKYIWTKRVSQLKGQDDDIKFGRRMARRILLGNGKKRMQKKRKNFMDAVSIRNVEVGLRASAKMEETCNCNNYSSICTVQICKKSLTHLEEVAKVLRSRYTEAKMIQKTNTEKDIFGCYKLPQKEKNRFYYITPSPNFCEETHGRECHDEMNCSILCCARGFRTKEIKKSRKCRCSMSAGKCCDIKCQNCPNLERKYICK